jgi:hypothetical protein
MARRTLGPDETILAVGRPGLLGVWHKYLLTGGLYGLWHKRHVAVLTDKRLMMGKGIISRQESSIPIKSIEGATYSRTGLAGYCILRDRFRQTTRVGPFRPRTAWRFVEELENRI